MTPPPDPEPPVPPEPRPEPRQPAGVSDAVEAALERYLALLDVEGAVAAASFLDGHPLVESLRARVAMLERLGLLHSRDPRPALPEQIGGYRILGMLGQGGMGVVYDAVADGGGAVALKCLRAEFRGDAAARRRFAREVAAAQALVHPGIVRLLDHGEDQEVPWLAMERVDGVSLQHLAALPESATTVDVQSWFQESQVVEPALGRLPTRRVELGLEVVRQAAMAVGHAHAHGIVHRDLKPSNLMLRRDGSVVVLDFGLAVARHWSRVTGTRGMVGSPLYVPPEVLAVPGREVGPRADVYALGVTLWELLTGSHPFGHEQSSAAPASAGAGSDTPFVRDAARLPRDVVAIAGKAFDPDPACRYADAGELAADLQRVLAFAPVLARLPGPATRLWRWLRRRPLLAGALAVLVPLAAGLPIVATWLAFAEQRAIVRRTEQIASFLTPFLRGGDPANYDGVPAVAPHLLAERADHLLADEAMEPSVRAQLARDLGTNFVEVGEFVRGERMLQLAARLAPDLPNAAAEIAATELAIGRMLQLRQDPAAPARLLAAAEALQQNPRTVRLALRARLWRGLALLRTHQGQGEAELAAVLTAAEDDVSPEATGVRLEARLALAGHRARSQKYVRAGEQLAAAEREFQRLPTPLPAHRLLLLRSTAEVAGLRGEHERALAAAAECAHSLERLHRDAEHPSVLTAECEVQLALFRAGRLEEAALLGARLVPALERRLDPLAAGLRDARIVRAKVLMRLGRHAEAVPLCRLVHDGVRQWAALEQRDPDPTGSGASLWQLGLALTGAGEHAAAERALQEALHSFEPLRAQPSRVQAFHCSQGQTRVALAQLYHRRGELARARAELFSAMEQVAWATPVQPADYREALVLLDAWHADAAERGTFIAWLTHEGERLRVREAEIAAEDNPWAADRLAKHRGVLGHVLRRLGRAEAALVALEAAAAELRATHGEHHRETRAVEADLTALR